MHGSPSSLLHPSILPTPHWANMPRRKAPPGFAPQFQNQSAPRGTPEKTDAYQKQRAKTRENAHAKAEAYHSARKSGNHTIELQGGRRARDYLAKKYPDQYPEFAATLAQ